VEVQRGESGGLVRERWRGRSDEDLAVLLRSTSRERGGDGGEARLQDIYGDIVGGFLIYGELKIAMLRGPEVFGLYRLEELWRREEVRRALSIDHDIVFFMDASNVWFYGVKGDELYVYDAETGELDSLGAIESAMDQLFDAWEDGHS
jgi:hypothetical protein